MKHHVAILACALTLAASPFVLVESASDATAATRTQHRPQVTKQVNRPQINRQVSRPQINRQVNRPQINRQVNRQVNRPQVTRQVHRPQVTRQVNRPQVTPSSRITRVPSGPNKINRMGGPNRPTGLTSAGPNNRINRMSGPNRPTGITATGPRRPPGTYINVVGPRAGGPNVARINNQNITIFRGRRDIFWRGRIRTLVALAVLGGITIGGTYFIADGYVPLAAPICRGITAEGCSLVWRDVATEDGDVIAQCVQFCPRRVATAVDAPVVAQPVAAPVPAAMAQGCEISIHAEPNFGGVNSDVTADQPQLGQYGWDKAISSINIKSGTWDFYSDDNYGGQMIRLGPGQYPTLAQGWDKTINSLMCAQP